MNIRKLTVDTVELYIDLQQERHVTDTRHAETASNSGKNGNNLSSLLLAVEPVQGK